LKQIRVMIAADGDELCAAMREYLAAPRSREAARNAAVNDDAMRRFLENQEDDAVMDLVMPAWEGFGLLDAIRQPRTAVPALPAPYQPRDGIGGRLLSLGIPAHLKGFQYLREAVRLVLEQPERIRGLTKGLYQAVALRWGTSASRVERAIRHAIEVGWNRGRVDALNAAFGCRVVIPEEKPSNGEFIALMVELLLEKRKRG